TVNQPIHIGKFRSYLLADVLRRHLERSGYEVLQVMNITDVGHLNEFEEDVVEIAAGRAGGYAWELAENEMRLFHADRRALGIRGAHEYPKAREHVEEMIETIRLLEEAGATYTEGGNLYLDITRYEKIGCLCGRSLQELEAAQGDSMTTEGGQKRNPLDIDLWRTDALHQMRWESPWGSGFPGWHVECVAMSRKYLGEFFDIHTGAEDNINPHHEFEMAQASVLSSGGDDRDPLSHYWLHSGSVSVEGQAMSKANGNVVPARELLESGIRGSVVRVALLSEHYRANLDFGEAALDRASEAVNLILGFRDHLRSLPGDDAADDAPAAQWIADTDAAFTAALDEDLDYWKAISAVVGAVGALEAETVGSPARALDALGDWDRVLGIF
ncbi:MAG: hypothetical protein VCD34_08575, partial [Planctomycetota bacterium]